MKFSELKGAPMTRQQLEHYLARIEMEPPAAPAVPGRQPDLAYLTRLQKAHVAHIPFENLDVMAGRPLSLDRETLYRKMIERKRGGVCSEINTLYNWLLESLGYDTISYISRIIAQTMPVQTQSHRVIGVNLEGRIYLTDAGFNYEHHRIPLLLTEDLVQDDGECQYKLQRDEFWGWIMWQNRPGYGWRRKIGFTQQPQIDLDFIPATFFAEAHPDSKINKQTKVSLHIDGVFHAIRTGNYLIERGGVEEILEADISPARERQLLIEVFGLPAAEV